MTVAAREAVALGCCLRRHGTRQLARRFLQASTREIAAPWEIAASSDLRLPAVKGRRSVKTRMTNRYLPHYFRAAEHDAQLSTAFLEVLNLLARPESLLTPGEDGQGDASPPASTTWPSAPRTPKPTSWRCATASGRAAST